MNKRDSAHNVMHCRLLVKDRKFLASSCPIAKGFRARGLIMRQKEKKKKEEEEWLAIVTKRDLVEFY